MSYKDNDDGLVCSFCGKRQDVVRKLVAGPGVYICDECIDLCNEIIAEDVQSAEEEAKELLRIRHMINDMLVEHTGQSLETVDRDTERDNFMSAQEAVAYGLIDKVVTRPNEAKAEQAGE